MVKVLLKGESTLREISLEDCSKSLNFKYLRKSRSAVSAIESQTPFMLRWFGETSLAIENAIEEGVVAPVSIRWVDDRFGYGLFAETPLDEGELIGHYTGVIRPVSRFHPELNGYCIHYPSRFWNAKYLVLDAEKEGNELRFVNHSDYPNLEVKCLLHKGMLVFCFFTKFPVVKGEQLTCYYGPDYWRSRRCYDPHTHSKALRESPFV